MEDNVQGSRKRCRVLEVLEQCIFVPSCNCDSYYYVSDDGKGIRPWHISGHVNIAEEH